MKVDVQVKRETLKTVARDQVGTGQLFRAVKRDGSLGANTYMSLARNGRQLSLNIGNGNLASSDNDTRPVSVVGSAKIDMHGVTLDPNSKRFVTKRETTRGEVATGEVFRVKGKDTLYVHLGELTLGRDVPKLAALRIGSGEDTYAVTAKRSKNVEVVGTASISGEAVA